MTTQTTTTKMMATTARATRTRALAAVAAALVLVGCGAPSADDAMVVRRPLLTDDEHARTVRALQPPKRARPVVAVLAENDGTETTDFVIPYSVLVEAGVADVVAVATGPGPIQLVPALTVLPQATTARFDARFPEGADYVVVPKLERRDDAVAVAWIRAQAEKGAIVVAICAGATTLSAAGLLHGRDATGHWYDHELLQDENPTMRLVKDRRYVVDRGVMTTTGVSASIPASLALVEAIGGAARARAVAARLGVDAWDERHESDRFFLDRTSLATGLMNKASFWAHDEWEVPVHDGVDELALALTADAWSRSRRSQALAVADRPVTSRRGLVVVPDRARPTSPTRAGVLLVRDEEAARALPDALDGIAARYGADTAFLVALQLEYAWRRSE